MTDFRCKRSREGFLEFSCDGHTGYAGRGSDVVCAAVSALVLNTVNSLTELAGEALRLHMDESKGSVEAVFERPSREKGTLLMESLILGLTQIQKEYGEKFLRIRIEEV